MEYYYNGTDIRPQGQPLPRDTIVRSMHHMNWKLFDVILLTDFCSAVNFDQDDINQQVYILTGIIQRAEIKASLLRVVTKRHQNDGAGSWTS